MSEVWSARGRTGGHLPDLVPTEFPSTLPAPYSHTCKRANRETRVDTVRAWLKPDQPYSTSAAESALGCFQTDAFRPGRRHSFLKDNLHDSHKNRPFDAHCTPFNPAKRNTAKDQITQMMRPGMARPSRTRPLPHGLLSFGTWVGKTDRALTFFGNLITSGVAESCCGSPFHATCVSASDMLEAVEPDARTMMFIHEGI